MRRCLDLALVLWVVLLVSFLPDATGPAAARMTLSQCIANEQLCKNKCYNPDSPLPPGSSVGPCWQQCEANHAACVDFAMELSADGGDGPTVNPPKGALGTVMQPGLLDAQPGFSTQGPAATGSPLGTGAGPQLR